MKSLVWMVSVTVFAMIRSYRFNHANHVLKALHALFEKLNLVIGSNLNSKSVSQSPSPLHAQIIGQCTFFPVNTYESCIRSNQGLQDTCWAEEARGLGLILRAVKTNQLIRKTDSIAQQLKLGQ